MPSVDRDALLATLRQAWNASVWVTCDPQTRVLRYISICFPPYGTQLQPIDCAWDPAADVPGGQECNGTLSIAQGLEPPPWCKNFFPELLANSTMPQNGTTSNSSSGGLSAGAIAGIAVGCAAAAVGLAAAVWLLLRRRRHAQAGGGGKGCGIEVASAAGATVGDGTAGDSQASSFMSELPKHLAPGSRSGAATPFSVLAGPELST